MNAPGNEKLPGGFTNRLELSDTALEVDDLTGGVLTNIRARSSAVNFFGFAFGGGTTGTELTACTGVLTDSSGVTDSVTMTDVCDFRKAVLLVAAIGVL